MKEVIPITTGKKGLESTVIVYTRFIPVLKYIQLPIITLKHNKIIEKTS